MLERMKNIVTDVLADGQRHEVSAARLDKALEVIGLVTIIAKYFVHEGKTLNREISQVRQQKRLSPINGPWGACKST